MYVMALQPLQITIIVAVLAKALWYATESSYSKGVIWHTDREITF